MSNKLMKKNASVIEEMRAMLRKQSEAQESVKGHPGTDLDFKGPEKKTETVDTNKVKPEDNKNGFDQKPSVESAGKVVSASEDEKLRKMSQDILSTLMKEADEKTESSEVQKTVTGVPGTALEPASPKKETETVDQNNVVPEKNDNGFGQKTKEDKKVIDEPAVKDVDGCTATKVSAAKIASYQLGAQLVADLMLASQHVKQAEQIEMLKIAGRRDFETIIDAAAAQLDKNATANGLKKNSPVKTAGFLDEAGEAASRMYHGAAGKIKHHANEFATNHPRKAVGATVGTGLLGAGAIGYGLRRGSAKMQDAKDQLKTSSINDIAAGILLKSAGIDPELEKQAEFDKGYAFFDQLYKQAEHQALIEKQAELENQVKQLLEEKQVREKQAADQLAKTEAEKKDSEFVSKVAQSVTSSLVNELKDGKSK